LELGKLELGKSTFEGKKLEKNGFRKIGFGISGSYLFSILKKFLTIQGKCSSRNNFMVL